MKKIYKITGMLMMCAALSAPIMTSCSDDNYDTQQYKGGVNLNVWGPRPVARGGELRFLGSGMDRITSITLPGAGDVTDISVVSNEEIRIIVPQNAEPGKVVLHHANGDIESLTELSFTEPRSLDEISPMTVKPGQQITLSGDYLNLIEEVIFTDEVAVGIKDFITHTRQEISLVVPAEAQTGKITISDGGEPIPNHIHSEEDVTIVLPSVERVADLTKIKPGETVTITVKDIDLVTAVEMPSGEQVEFNVNEDKLSFVLPADVTDGTICMLPASGVKVAIATIGVALPEEVVADPASAIWGGDVIKFKGINMELVTGVSFPNVEEIVVPDNVTPTEISVTVPAGTQSGNAVLRTASGGAVDVEISTLKPEAVAYTPAPAALASSLKVTGRNLQNVTAITFGGAATVEVTGATATEFTVNIPATLTAGSNTVTLTLSNGETIDTDAIELTAPECAYATELPAEDAEINAGETFSIMIANADKLTGVKVNGNDVQYILNGNRLIIQVPESAGKNSTFTLLSSNGEISYNIAFIPATHVENVIFSEVRDLGSWAGEDAGGAFRLYKSSFEGVPAGAKLVFHISPYDYTQIQVNDANWGQMAMLEPAQTATTAEFELSAEVLNRILTTDDGWSETAMVIQGQGTVVSKVHIEWENSLETVFWTGNADLTGWGGMQDFAWNDDAIANIFSTWKPGQILRAYYTTTGGSQPCIKFGRGEDWAMLPGSAQEYYDCPASQTNVEFILTADDINQLVNNHGLLIQGNDIILTKLTIE